MYRSEASVVEAIDCLLAQSYRDVAVVAVDDCSPDATYEVALARFGEDPRVTVEANSSRLGLCANWNRVLTRAIELYPDCELFAWASDNDIHDPTWLAEAVDALDRNPAAVLAFSRAGKFVHGRSVPARQRRLDDRAAAARPIDRMCAVVGSSRDPGMVFGLLRVGPLRRVGGKPSLVAPDVLLLCHLSLYGEFARCPDYLFHLGKRRTGGTGRRQRAAVFAGRPPLWSYLPVQLQRLGWLTGQLVIGDRRPPGVGRLGACGLIARFFVADVRQEVAGIPVRIRKDSRRRAKERRG
ncbi:MAG TPA: glycosyltransferase [Gaiellaceae bacterium]|jgi:glycosyltransferase involved in cell wall biosynthesis